MEWFTSDWHLGHKNILSFDKRPYKTLKEMSTELIKNINKLVEQNDILYVLGDVAYKINDITQIEIFLNRIICENIILILGNHDKFKPFEYVDVGFQSVHTSLKVEDYILVHDPAIAGCMSGTKFICGHVHRLFTVLDNVLNVSCCVWDYKPISLDNIKYYLEK